MSLGDGVNWNEAVPDNNTVANEIDDYDRDLRVGVRSRLAREHVFPASQTATNEGGHHNFITLQVQTAAPAMTGTTAGALWVKSSDKGIYITDSAANDYLVVASGKGISINFGTWSDKSSDYAAQQATAASIIMAYAVAVSGASVLGFTDTAANPTTTRVSISFTTQQTLSITFPVKKNDYWKITTTGTVNSLNVFMLPFPA